ncbi:MAG: hydroxymethylglutaryl-CoA lyase [Rhodobacteraceae bacterium]|nr:hydroxymethylglutaryl-CoA lyase [Paracoccaceae bacterium]
MSDFPKFVEFREEGPREGFQIEKTIHPIEQRAELIDLLGETGLKRIMVGSFVSPKYVPQMADTGELFTRIKRQPGVEYSTMWLNEKGFLNALAAQDAHINPMLLYYTSDAFCRRNNNCSMAEMAKRQKSWIALYRQHGYEVETVGITTAFGCNFQGEIPLSQVLDVVRGMMQLCEETGTKVPTLSIADTMGWANPEAVKRMIDGLRNLLPETRIAMHFHDTRGLGIANLYAALQMGVDLFDSAIGGLGGCPFGGFGDTRAAGNIATEDSVFMCHEMGIETGLDLEKLIVAATKAEEIIGTPLMSRVLHSGGLDRFRA